MTQLQDRFKSQTMSGETVTLDGVTVTPQSQSVTVRWPRGGWVWNRPVAVMVGRDEERKRIPIVDVTRVAQIGLFAFAVVFSIAGLVLWTRERSAQNE